MMDTNAPHVLHHTLIFRRVVLWCRPIYAFPLGGRMSNTWHASVQLLYFMSSLFCTLTHGVNLFNLLNPPSLFPSSLHPSPPPPPVPSLVSVALIHITHHRWHRTRAYVVFGNILCARDVSEFLFTFMISAHRTIYKHKPPTQLFNNNNTQYYTTLKMSKYVTLPWVSVFRGPLLFHCLCAHRALTWMACVHVCVCRTLSLHILFSIFVQHKNIFWNCRL
jgi:hypothetical protein